MLYRNTKKMTHVGIAIALALAALAPVLAVRTANAAALARVFVRFDSMEAGSGSTGTVCANPTTSQTEAEVRVTFPTGYTVSGTAGNHTVSTANLAWPSGGNAWPGINTATAVSGQVVTFPSTDLTPGTLYCFNWTNAA